MLETTIRRYTAAWAARDRAAWLATFAPDAVQEDPVGEPARQGQAALAAYWDEAMARYSAIAITPREVYISGQEAAVVWTMAGTVLGSQRAMSFDGVDTLRFDGEGRIVSLRSYW